MSKNQQIANIRAAIQILAEAASEPGLAAYIEERVVGSQSLMGLFASELNAGAQNQVILNTGSGRVKGSFLVKEVYVGGGPIPRMQVTLESHGDFEYSV